MGRESWFGESNEFKFARYVEKMESWQKALADGIVQPEELQAQMERVTGMMRVLEPKLSDELHQEVTELFYELAVFYGMARMAELTQVEKGEA